MAFAATMLFACKPPEPVEVAGITLNHATLQLAIGETEQLTVTFSPNDASNKTLTWLCLEASIATVENGLITGVSEGTTTIYVSTLNGKSAECVVTVGKTIVINEAYSNGGRFTDDGTSYGDLDWVELFNNSNSEKDVSGFMLYDKEDKSEFVILPENTKIAAHGFLFVEVDVAGGFGLSSGGDKVYLENAAGEVIDQIEFGALAIDEASARKPDGSATWVVQTPTPGTSNNSVVAKPIISNFTQTPASPTDAESVFVGASIVAGDGELTTTQLVWKVNNVEKTPITLVFDNTINTPNFYDGTIPAQEVGAVVEYTIVAENSAGGRAEKSGSYTVIVAGIDYSVLVINEIDGNGKFVEIYNKSNSAVNLYGVYLVKNEKTANEDIWWTGGDVSIAAHGYYSIQQSGQDPALGTEQTGLNGISPKQNVKFELKAPNTSVIDEFVRTNGGAWSAKVKPEYDSTTPQYSFARCPDGTGDFGLAVPSCNAANPATADGPIVTDD